jgi:hypothetical protein
MENLTMDNIPYTEAANQEPTRRRSWGERRPEPGDSGGPAADPHLQQVVDWLRLFIEPGQVLQLLALKVPQRYGGPRTVAGNFNYDHIEEAARAALELTSNVSGVYFTINPLKVPVLARRANRVDVAAEGELINDGDVERRRWLFIDVDGAPTKGVSATEAEKAKAREVALAVREHLRGRGWPEPIFGDSGNGYHLLYRIDLPADDGGLVKRVLEALSAQFNNDPVKIDPAVSNPGRHGKVFGTLARKGDFTADRPHRRAKILDVPEKREVVAVELLEKLAAEAPAEKTTKVAKPAASTNRANGHRLKVGEWLSDHDIEYRTKSLADGRTAYLLAACPFDAGHTGKDVAIFQDAEGKLGANCFHASCTSKGWQEFRDQIGPPLPEHYDPPLRGTQRRQAPEVVVTQDDRDVVGKLEEMLAEGGTAALFRNTEVLQALARLRVAAPAESGAARAILRRKRVSISDLDQALQPYLEELHGAGDDHAAGAGGASDYMVDAGVICRWKETEDGPVTLPLCNFTASIVEEVVCDDGVEQRITLALEGKLHDGTDLPRKEIPAENFSQMNWVTPAWGSRAVVNAGQGTRDHLRAALQLLSPTASRRTVYTHTGWRQVQGRWYYLHGGGAIGSNGLEPNVVVDLGEALAGYVLPAPPTGEELKRAVQASLRLLTLGPARIMWPLVASIYRAALGGTDYAVHVTGATGTFKSETAALIQQHYGQGMDARHLPANWSSTANALEGLAFAAKDGVLVVDDFCPTGSQGDVQKFHKEADRLFRAQGNRSGRQRMRADGSLRPTKPPRGLILSTGEDVPRGQSLRARLPILEVAQGDIDRDKLTACQQDAAAGLYAQAMSAFLNWVAPRYQQIRDGLRQERDEIRSQLLANGHNGHNGHSRTTTCTAEILLGARYLLAFAQEVGALTAAEAADWERRAWEATLDAASRQAEHLQDADPTNLFLRLLTACLTSGRAHLVHRDGGPPLSQQAAYGWKWVESHDGTNNVTNNSERGYWSAQGRKIGWVDLQHLYLEPEAAYAEVQRLAGEQNQSLPVTSRSLFARLHERGLLALVDGRGGSVRYTVRRRLEESQHRVLVLPAGCLSPVYLSGHCGHVANQAAENGNSDVATGHPAGPGVATPSGHMSGAEDSSGHTGHSPAGRDAPVAEAARAQPVRNNSAGEPAPQTTDKPG